MKISKLITHKQTINSWSIADEASALIEKLKLIEHSIEKINVLALGTQLSAIKSWIDNVNCDISYLQEELSQTNDQILEEVNNAAHDSFVGSQAMYEKSKTWFNKERAEEIREQDLFADEEVREKFANIIKRYATWQYPSVYVRPNKLHFFDALKASGMLYVMDQHQAIPYMYRNLTKAEFEYIRFKQIDETKDKFVSDLLPAGQVGFVVMDNFINFKPMDIIKQYLLELMEVLHDGGHCLFTFNDCDLPSGAINYENGLYCFTPGRLLLEMCKMVGFDVVHSSSSDRLSWILIKKPGELSSIKGGKTLGQIITKQLD